LSVRFSSKSLATPTLSLMEMYLSLAAQGQETNPLQTLLGLAIFAGWVFAFVMWCDSLTVPGQTWKDHGHDKAKFFVLWYVGGLLTFGLVPVGMSVWYLRSIRPDLRPKRVPTTSTSPLPLAVGVAHGASLPERPAAWYLDPSEVKRLRYWDGNRWTEHVAD